MCLNFLGKSKFVFLRSKYFGIVNYCCLRIHNNCTFSFEIKIFFKFHKEIIDALRVNGDDNIQIIFVPTTFGGTRVYVHCTVVGIEEAYFADACSVQSTNSLWHDSESPPPSPLE